MSFNESIVEAATLDWFRELGYAIGVSRTSRLMNRWWSGMRSKRSSRS